MFPCRLLNFQVDCLLQEHVAVVVSLVHFIYSCALFGDVPLRIYELTSPEPTVRKKVRVGAWTGVYIVLNRHVVATGRQGSGFRASISKLWADGRWTVTPAANSILECSLFSDCILGVILEHRPHLARHHYLSICHLRNTSAPRTSWTFAMLDRVRRSRTQTFSGAGVKQGLLLRGDAGGWMETEY
jgi:hypothetical protein